MHSIVFSGQVYFLNGQASNWKCSQLGNVSKRKQKKVKE
jgi:hypothetical protein